MSNKILFVRDLLFVFPSFPFQQGIHRFYDQQQQTKAIHHEITILNPPNLMNVHQSDDSVC